MGYREVTMVEVKEVLRLWLGGVAKRRIAAELGLDVKTVRRYLAAARSCGLERARSETTLDETLLLSVLSALRLLAGRPRGEAWSRCAQQRDFIARHLAQGVRLSKIVKLLRRQGVEMSYAMLRRYAMVELGFGRNAATMPTADCGPGEEVQLDTGWMTHLEPDSSGKRRRFRAWIFTPVVSRYRFPYPCLAESTETGIEACEAAWEFYGGVFKTVVVDNTRAIVHKADALEPRLSRTFLEYAQARGFHVDTTRVRSPRDKARVERTVAFVRDDCFGGERLLGVEQARELAQRWALEDAGMHRHSTTGRLPREHFESVEKPVLLPAPTSVYDVPLWCEPKVARDHFAQVARALYSLPTRFIGKRLTARADKTLVRFYEGAALVKTHPRQPPRGRAIDVRDFPEHKTPYALRDIGFLQREAARHGEAVGAFANKLLEGPLPWTRMRRVYALLGLARRYGDARLEQACQTALDADMIDVRRLEQMLRLALPDAQPAAPAPLIPLARYLRPPAAYRLRLVPRDRQNQEGEIS
jgi:transposase